MSVCSLKIAVKLTNLKQDLQTKKEKTQITSIRIKTGDVILDSIDIKKGIRVYYEQLLPQI